MKGIRPARSDEWGTIASLMGSAALPTNDLSQASLPMFSVYVADDRIDGAVAIDRRGESAMLRSLVVLPHARRGGIGRALVVHAEMEARALGLHALYLLTDAAESFFTRCGYERIDRTLAPEAIRSHPQFKSLCPASAALMHKALR